MGDHEGMVFGDGDGVPQLMEVRPTARLDTSEILHLIEQSEGVEVMERMAHNLRGTPQFGVPAAEPEPPEIAVIDDAALEAPGPADPEAPPRRSRAGDLVLGAALGLLCVAGWIIATMLP
jgi:hypothetical protein